MFLWLWSYNRLSTNHGRNFLAANPRSGTFVVSSCTRLSSMPFWMKDQKKNTKKRKEEKLIWDDVARRKVLVKVWMPFEYILKYCMLCIVIFKMPMDEQYAYACLIYTGFLSNKAQFLKTCCCCWYNWYTRVVLAIAQSLSLLVSFSSFFLYFFPPPLLHQRLFNSSSCPAL